MQIQRGHFDAAIAASLRQLTSEQLRTLLTNYYRRLRGRYKVPVFAHRELDVHKVFWTVVDKGGYYLVSQTKQWKEVCRCLAVDLRGQTSASYNMRLNYEKCLLDFEKYCASGQYAADLAQGTAPSYEEVTEPQRDIRPECRAGQKRERPSPKSAGLQVDQVSLADDDLSNIPDSPPAKQRKLTDESAVRVVDAAKAGFSGSFIELLASGGAVPFLDSMADVGEPAAAPARAPWMRMVGPQGVPAEAPLANGEVVWVPPVAIPAAAYGDERMLLQRQAPLPEPLGTFLQRRGARAISFKVQRLLPASQNWVTATLIDYSINSGCHCLRYDPSSPAAPAGTEWVQLSLLPDTKLRCHPGNPLPGFLGATVPEQKALDTASVPDDAMRGIVNALLSGVTPSALKRMVEFATATLGLDTDADTDTQPTMSPAGSLEVNGTASEEARLALPQLQSKSVNEKKVQEGVAPALQQTLQPGTPATVSRSGAQPQQQQQGMSVNRHFGDSVRQEKPSTSPEATIAQVPAQCAGQDVLPQRSADGSGKGAVVGSAVGELCGNGSAIPVVRAMQNEELIVPSAPLKVPVQLQPLSTGSRRSFGAPQGALPDTPGNLAQQELHKNNHPQDQPRHEQQQQLLSSPNSFTAGQSVWMSGKTVIPLQSSPGSNHEHEQQRTLVLDSAFRVPDLAGVGLQSQPPEPQHVQHGVHGQQRNTYNGVYDASVAQAVHGQQSAYQQLQGFEPAPLVQRSMLPPAYASAALYHHGHSMRPVHAMGHVDLTQFGSRTADVDVRESYFAMMTEDVLP